jgi:septum site-determining protein MinC
VIHRFAERELKLKLFQNDPQGAAVPAPLSVKPPARPAIPRREDPEIEELATEELVALDDDGAVPAVLLPASAGAGRSSFARVTLPHDLKPEDLAPAAVLEPVAENRATATPLPTPKPVAPPQGGSLVTGPPVGSNRTQTLHKTLRSGSVVKFDGDVVVFGDVNPGAQIVASGNIAVLGALKGMAHAGCDGDESAFVLAFDLRATQIRIAAKIAVPTGRGLGAEVATVSGDEIVVEPYRAGVPGARKPRPAAPTPPTETESGSSSTSRPADAPRPARLARGR